MALDKEYLKKNLCRGPWICALGKGPNPKSASGPNSPPTDKKGALCRGPAPGALGKQTALGKLAPDKYGRMGHGGHWRQSLPSVRRQALGKDFLFFLNILCRGSLARPSAKTPFTEGQARPSAKSFFFVF